MRVQKRSPWLNGLGVVLAAMALWGTQAQAQVSSDKTGSVVLWPKVIADGTRDTLITLTNTRNEQAYAHCEYIQSISICSLTGAYCSNPSVPPAPNAVPPRPGSPGACPGGTGDFCQQVWQAADFDVVLTRQQPTIWRVSTGRQDNPFLPADGRCDLIDDPNPNVADSQSCPGLFLIGNVPTSGVPFRGSLTCVQVSMDGSLLGSDGLKGEATIETLGSTQISTYNSYNFQAVGDVGSEPGLVRLDGIEYSACPEAVEVSHYASGAQDVVADSIDPAVCDPVEGCPVQAQITLVPCRADYLAVNQGPVWATDIQIYNEFESRTSIETPLECWANFDLRDLGYPPAAASGTTFQRSVIRSIGDGRCIVGNVNASCDADADCGTGGVCGPVTGLLALVEEFHDTAASLADPPTGVPGTAASNGYLVDLDGDGSLERPGHCRGNLSQTCTSNADCPTGLCRLGGGPCLTDATCLGDDNFCDRCMNDELLNLSAGSIEPIR